jgi:N-acetylglucosamine-6-phosphate deacetylase
MPCIYNAKLILSDRIVDRGWLLIDDELIRAAGEGVPPVAPDRFDANGSYLAPGFIDLHVHGGGGSDFLDATTEAFLTAADFHLSGGTTSICPTAATTTYDHFDSFLSAWTNAKERSKARLLFRRAGTLYHRPCSNSRIERKVLTELLWYLML